MLLGNCEVNEQERLGVVEKLEKLFKDLLKHPDPKQSAVKVEDSVFQATITREDYRKMIISRMQFLQQQMINVNNNVQNTLSNSMHNAASNSMNSTHSSSSNNMQNIMQSTSSPSMQKQQLSMHEKSEIHALLSSIQPDLPQIDKILAINTSTVSSTKLDPELIRKFSSLRNILVKQIDLLPMGTFILTVSKTVALVDQLKRLLQAFSTTLAGGSDRFAILAGKISKYKQICMIDSYSDHAKGIARKGLQAGIMRELNALSEMYPGLVYFVEGGRGDLVSVRISYQDKDIAEIIVDSAYPDCIHRINNLASITLDTRFGPQSITSLLRQYFFKHRVKENF